jgi:hypothetical protein
MHAVENKRGGGRQQMRVENCIAAFIQSQISNPTTPPSQKKKTFKNHKENKKKKGTRSDKLDGCPRILFFLFLFHSSIISTSVCSSLLDTTRCCNSPPISRSRPSQIRLNLTVSCPLHRPGSTTTSIHQKLTKRNHCAFRR